MRLKMLPFIAAMLAATLMPSVAAAAKPDKVEMCRVGAGGVPKIVNVVEKNVDKRLARGDYLPFADGSCIEQPPAETVVVFITVIDTMAEGLPATVTFGDNDPLFVYPTGSIELPAFEPITVTIESDGYQTRIDTITPGATADGGTGTNYTYGLLPIGAE